MKGTLINVATVVAGSAIGLVLRSAIPAEAQTIALSGLGLVTFGLGIKLFFESKNILVVAIAIAVGGMIGLQLGIQNGLVGLGDQLKHLLSPGATKANTFTEGFVAASVLFCVGPMTILGCLQDGLEGKTELLALKSTMDGVAAIFLSATLGIGVLASALVVLIFQGALTMLASTLKWLRDEKDILAEFSGTGGVIMLAIGFSLLDIKRLPTANFLPALLLAPAFQWLGTKYNSKLDAKKSSNV